MRLVRFIAFVAWAGVALLAVAGFAAFSPDGTDSVSNDAPASVEAGLDARGNIAGGVAAQTFVGGPGSDPVDVYALAVEEELAVYERLQPQTSIIPATTTTTTTPTPSTTTSAPATTSTTIPETTTTIPPTTTTTTTATSAPPESTTTSTTVPDETSEALGGVGPCLASYYGDAFAGRQTASGEIFDPSAMTAATHYIPFNTMVTVTRVDTGATVTVRINDRGPYLISDGGITRHPTRCIDLSKAAMNSIGGLGAGVITVTLAMPADTPELDRLQSKYGAL